MSRSQRVPKEGLRPGLVIGLEESKYARKKTDVKKTIDDLIRATDLKLPAKCLMLAHQHYVVSGSIGTTAKLQTPLPFVIDTGAGYNVIRKSSLPPGWKGFVTGSTDLPALGDAGGHALNTLHEVLLRVRFGNALYRVSFLVVEKLAVPVVLGTQFTNRHVDAIRCIRGKVEFTRDTLPIIGHGAIDDPWSDSKARYVETGSKHKDEAAEHDESHLLTRIRLAKPLLIPAHTQKKALATTLLEGVIVTEPKHSVMQRYGVRVMNSVHEVHADRSFTIVVSNFSSKERLLPKGMIVAYASRSPMGFMGIEERSARDVMKTFGIEKHESSDSETDDDLAEDPEAAAVLAMVDEAFRRGEDPGSFAANLLLAMGDGPDVGTDEGNAPLTETITPEVVEDIPRPGTADGETPETAAEVNPDWRSKIDLSHLTDAKLRKRVMDLLEKHAPVFEGRLGKIKATVHRINLKPGSKPFRMQPYRAGPDKREKIREQIEYQLAAGVIEPAQSEWSSPVLLAPKKDGTQRFCIDLRRLNDITIPDTYPLPRMDDCIDSLSEAMVFTLLDALWGYWQMPLADEDKDKTTFTTHMGTFRCLRMPFGLRNAPSSFQRALDIILSGVRWRFCLVYIDDIIVFSKNYEEHLDHLDQILTLLEDAGVKLKLKKCFFLKDEVEYLGFRIRPGTLGACRDASAMKAIRDAKFPTTPTIMKSFLGACNVYRRFVKGFASVSTPLTDMLKKESGTEWGPDLEPTEEQREAFQRLKDALVRPPVLALPVRNRPYMIDCDASAYAIGVVLLQQQDETKPKEWATVGYYSKTLTKEQRNYSASERECYAVVWAILTLRPYLEGAPFMVRTDHDALKWMLTLNDPSGRLMRWRLRLMEFPYEIVYRPGRKHQVPDALSRLEKPPSTDDDEVDDEIPGFAVDLHDVVGLINVVTRRRARDKQQSAESSRRLTRSTSPSPLTPDAAEPSADPSSSVSNQLPTGPELRPLVRPSRLRSGTDREWKDTSFLPLPSEAPEDEDDEHDLIADARDAIVEGTAEVGGHPFSHTHHDDADALPAPLTLSEIAEAQQTDEFCQSVVATQLSQRGTLFFESDEGILCRRDPRVPDAVQIVLPKCLRPRVLRLAHYHQLAGHPGQTRLCNRLKRTYYWPQMAADATTTVRECESCSKNRIRLLKQAGAMKLFQASRPLEDLAIDILGPLPKSSDGNLFILVIVDRFSKLTQCVPLKSITALSVAVAFVNEWVFKYGAPRHLLSDNGSQFISDLFHRVCAMLKVQNSMTLTYHPQTNGQTERFNRTLVAMLRCYVEDHPKDWCKYVRALTYAYNSAIHRATSATPFDLVLSRSPPDFTVSQPVRLGGRRAAKWNRHDHVARLRVALAKATASLKKHQARYKRDFDRRVRPSMTLTTDDKVYLDVTDGVKKDKLSYGVAGAFDVLEVDQENKTVTIQRGNVTERVSMNRVTRAPRSAKTVGPDSPHDLHATRHDLADKATEGETYYFKRILDHRTLDDGAVQFKLDWENYPPSWTDRSNVPEESVSRYLARLANERVRLTTRAPVSALTGLAPPSFRYTEFTCILDHRLLPDGTVLLFLQWPWSPPSWVHSDDVPAKDREAYFASHANAALARLFPTASPL